MVCSRKRRFEEDERQSIPNVLQGEVARLDPKFLVNLDPSHCSNNGTVHLICKLGECPGLEVEQLAIHALGQSPGPSGYILVACHVLTWPAHCCSCLVSFLRKSLPQLPRSSIP